MDINSLANISSAAVKNTFGTSSVGVTAGNEEVGTAFSNVFQSALDNITQTNSYLSDAENEELKWSLGLTENTHDLTIALNKASTALQYTVAVRDKFLEAYKELMQMQV